MFCFNMQETKGISIYHSPTEFVDGHQKLLFLIRITYFAGIQKVNLFFR